MLASGRPMGKAPSGFQIEDKSEVESHLRSIFQTLKKPFIYFEDDPALVVAILHRACESAVAASPSNDLVDTTL